MAMSDSEPTHVGFRVSAHLIDSDDPDAAVCGLDHPARDVRPIGGADPLEDFGDLCGSCERILRLRREPDPEPDPGPRPEKGRTYLGTALTPGTELVTRDGEPVVVANRGIGGQVCLRFPDGDTVWKPRSVVRDAIGDGRYSLTAADGGEDA